MQLIFIYLTGFLIHLSFFNHSDFKIIVDENEVRETLKGITSDKEDYIKENIEFWEAKLLNDSRQYPYKLKIADLQNQLFNVSGNVTYLKSSTEYLENAVFRTDYAYPSLLRKLSRNYITEHRFRDAYELLDKAEYIGEGVLQTQKMLFDVHMEIGNYELAGCYLAEISEKADFDYFIRMAKWQDFLGELDHAIHFMELAKDQAVRLGDKNLMIWSYTNLGDFYGHAGSIKEAYKLYVETLRLDPENAYALKQIAWIAFSHERNGKKALTILEAIKKRNIAPDILILKADISEYLRDLKSAQNYRDEFINRVTGSEYGRMYNTHVIELLLDGNQPESALAMVEAEVIQRPTPEIHALLAECHFKIGDKTTAYKILKNRVVDFTSEPGSMLIAAEVYKEMGELDFVRSKKKELMESVFELGPLMEEKIREL